MPIIKLTQKDIAKMHPPDAGVYLAELKDVTEGASKDKQSVNWNFEFEIVSDGASQGRYAYTNANSKAPAMTMGPLISAINDIPISEVKADDYDTDKLLGKRVGIEVVDEIYEGKIVKKIKSFIAPSAMKAPF